MGSGYKLELSGTKALLNALKSADKIDKIKQAVKVNGAELNERMQRQTENAYTKGYSIGDTRKSIRTTLKNGGMAAEVGPTTDYSPYVEFGTRFMDAEPVVKPALNAQKDQFIKDIEEAIK